VGQQEEGPSARGSKLATLRTRRASAGLLPPVALSASQGHARAFGRPVLEQARGVRPGALRLAERGFRAGAPRAEGKRTRQVDVLIPRTAPRRATQEAMALADLADKWDAYPARAAQTMAWGRGVEHMARASQRLGEALLEEATETA